MIDESLKEARKKLILDLGTDNPELAIELVEKLHPYVGMFRIGLELICGGGIFDVIEAILKVGGKIFYDVKLNDSPEVVSRTVRQIVKNTSVKIISIHATSGRGSMEAAVLNKGNVKIFANTVLPSIGDNGCQYNFGTYRTHAVLRFAKESTYPKCDGLICTTKELSSFKQHSDLMKMQILVYCTDIDSVRSSVSEGATYILVRNLIRRPIGMLQVEAAFKVLQEINLGLKTR